MSASTRKTTGLPARDKAGKPAATPAVAYQVTTPHGDGGISQPFETLAGAQRALEKIRQLYPDAFITTLTPPR